ncbi:MAG: beta-glucosidase [Anaerolineales bacterium]
MITPTKDIKNLISQMTLEEKASLCSGKDFWHLKGIERLGIPSIMVTDGPHGLRKQIGSSDSVGLQDSVPATCFPTASALAASWDRELVFEVGQALGEECREAKVGVILGPGANIKRSPLCGRNFEYFSEDPYLTGEMAKSYINGVQSQGIGTSLKHYAVNNQEYHRMTIDTLVDERALREIYLTGFEIAVKEAQPWTVMCAYNKVNGTYCAENRYLMTDILKGEWGHQGLVVTDWGAINDRLSGLKAGTELEMPGVSNGNDALLVEAIQAGQLEENILDQAVERILTLIFKAKETLSEDFTYDRQAHHNLARRAAAEGAVLLKNEAGILPIQQNSMIALIGQFAKSARYQGAGSSLINPNQLDNLHDELARLIGLDNLVYAPGYSDRAEQPDETLIQEAINTVQTVDVVVVCAGLTDYYEVEGLDRQHMHLPPGHDALILRLAQVHDKIIVVLSNGSPVEMPWVGDVAAVLEGYLGGQAGAGAIADILVGKTNPCGKLAETFPRQLEDNPSYHYFPMGPSIVEYRESIFVGYRYYDSVNQDVLFPFGHGLNYTTFEYRDLHLSHSKLPDRDPLTATFKIKNTGSVPGKEIIQLYLRAADLAVFHPEKELKGFVKVDLQPGEETEVSMMLNQRAFSYYDPQIKDWQIGSGIYQVLVGASSRDIRLKASIEVESTRSPTQQVERDQPMVYYNFPKGSPVSKEEFAALLGKPIPENQFPTKGEYTLNTPLGDMRGSFIGRQLLKYMQSQVKKMIAGQEDTPTAYLLESMVQEMPLRSIVMMSGGVITRDVADELLRMINGHFFSGFFSLIKAIFFRKE